ncbi:MAG: Kelch repeat-containing protein, partial [Myxococcales bacterium]
TSGTLSLATGVASPGATGVGAASTNVSMLQMTFTAGNVEDVRIAGLTVRGGGTGDEVSGIVRVRLFRDVNGSGELETGDVQLGTPQLYGADNGTVSFSGLTETVTAGGRLDLIVVYDLSSTVLPNQTFSASVAAAAVNASGLVSRTSINVSGSAAGATKTVQNATLQVSEGLANPAASTETATATGVPMLQVALTAGPSSSVRVRSLTFTATGSADDVAAVQTVRLFRDSNGNGAVDSGETELGTGAYVANNGTVVFGGLSLVLSASTRQSVLVVYDLSGAAGAGQTLGVNLASNAAVQAFDANTGVAAAVSGAPVVGELKTIAAQFNVWSGMSPTGAPTGRMNHTAVWAGNRMVVWGGENASGVLGTGGLYDPGADSWAAMPTSGAPSARTLHVSAAVGSRVLIWGGTDGGSFFSDGRVFDVSTGTWTAVAATNAPSARAYATAVTTGSEILVWGGTDGAALGTGARYDPASNSWTAINTTGAPSARYGHAAVWTGSRMIVWGGYSGVSFLANGASYDPGSNTWTALPAAPISAVAFHTGVWTGSEMQAWGGFDGATYRDNGAGFVPSSNAWRTLPTLGMPIGRSQHTAVYTGRATVVWGGWNGTALGDGARLQSLTNNWSPVSTACAPTVCFGHTAVWTGTHMIIWGGATTSSYLATGGRYTP